MPQDTLAPQRATLLAVALQDTRKWCGAPDIPVEHRQPDRYWLELFGDPARGEITTEHARLFLAGFHLEGPGWGEAKVAAFMTALRDLPTFDPKADVPTLTERLKACSSRRIDPLSPVSKLAFFARPATRTFLWDPMVLRSGQVRDGLRGSPGGKTGLLDRLFGAPDFSALYDSAERALLDEVGRPDFRAAADELVALFDRSEGIIADRSRIPGDYVERRLLDKLMFWEGWSLRYKRTPDLGMVA